VETADAVVIGGGIAGASVAAELARIGKVVLLEAESHPGYHATGRSAAYFAPSYGNEVVRAMTVESEPFYRTPPAGFSDLPLLIPRPALFVGMPEQAESIRTMKEENPGLSHVDEAEVIRRVPIVRRGAGICGLLDEAGGDLDVDKILQGYLRELRRAGGTVVTGARVNALSRVDGAWHIRYEEGQVAAPIVVNAAGAWADQVADMAGIGGLGLVPKRRTAMLIDLPEAVLSPDWPLTIDVDENFYFKPDAGKLLLSPADETTSEPCDAQPEELDVAVAVDRLMSMTSVSVDQIAHRWAGLRTFAEDKTFVVGYDPRVTGFFWLAGQGGYGVQTAPGLSRFAAALVAGSTVPRSLDAIVPEVAPDRLLV
jgi:D-arginine dehydrogenase